jgi:Ca-activated chloride channel homolog
VIKTSYDFSQGILPVGSSGNTDVLLRFRADVPQSPRRKLNLSLAIDRSGSMAGAALHHALKAAEAVVDKLEPDDILSVVTYDDDIATIFGPAPVTDRAGVKTLIRKVRAGGITNLSGGWLQSCEHVKKNFDANSVNRVLLLTDGHANAGISDPKILMNTAAKKNEEGIVTTTLGFAQGFNEDLLISMARAATGNFYFIQSIDDASEVFEIELDTMKSVIAQNLTATLEFSPNVSLVDTLSLAKVSKDASGKTVLVLGDMYEGEDKLLGLTLNLPELSSTGEHPILSLFYTADAIQNSVINQVSRDANVVAKVGSVEEAATAYSSSVTLELSRLKIAKGKETALELADKNNYVEAEQILRSLIKELKDKGLNENFEIAEETEQLEYFADRMSKKDLGNESRKELLDQSFQGLNRSRTDLSGRGTTAGDDVQALKVVTDVGSGVELECVREGGKLRIKVISDGYDGSMNVQFPRAIRAEGARYIVASLETSADGSFYRVEGDITRYAKPGEPDTFVASRSTRTRSSVTKVAATAADLETTDTVGDGVLIQCVKDGSKLRARVVSDGYESTWNMRFPRSIREEGTLYVVDEVNTAPDGKSYIASGEIKRFVQPTVTN